MAFILTNSEGAVGMPAAIRALLAGRTALDIVECGIREVEADPRIHSVGRGGWPNLLGTVELDACIMDGGTLLAGAVGALQGYVHPISIARRVMERLPHVLLVGRGAARFARECGEKRARLLTPTARRRWREWLDRQASPQELADWPRAPLIRLCGTPADAGTEQGTTAFLVIDAQGALGAGVSTSGLAWKYPGRLGDSPLIGAGCYADARYGAAACIGTGEMTIRAGTARAVVLYLKMGLDVRSSCHEALRDLRALKGGARGAVTILAVDMRGAHHALCIGEEAAPTYHCWRPPAPVAEERAAESDEL